MTGVSVRIALGVQYDGSAYSGWQLQSQPSVVSVQGRLEKALQSIATVPVRVYCAGRTDAGVHATGQVVHFDCALERPLKAWLLGSNSELPADISIQWVCPVPNDFHARFSATARRYQYVIYNEPVRPALLNRQLSWHRARLNHELMHREAQSLLGERDFSAFRAAGCQSKSPWRCVNSVSVSRHGKLVLIDIEANAFLHHMVRNIAGVLMAVGDGRHAPGWVDELLRARDRTKAAATAPPFGLYLVQVSYPSAYALPQLANSLPFLP